MVTSNPTQQIVASGSTVSFVASASGVPTPVVDWQLSTDGGRTFSNIAGSDSTVYSFVATAAQTGDVLKAVFNNSGGTVVTAPAVLTVSDV